MLRCAFVTGLDVSAAGVHVVLSIFVADAISVAAAAAVQDAIGLSFVVADVFVHPTFVVFVVASRLAAVGTR